MVISRLEKEAEVTKTQNDKAADARIKLAVLSTVSNERFAQKSEQAET